MQCIRHVTAFLSIAALAACSATSTSSEPDAASPPHDAGADTSATPDAGSTKALATLKLSIPADYVGTPRQLNVVLVDRLPVAGPPSSILYQESAPQLAAGQTLTVRGDASGVHGSFYVVVVLYMQGGGSFSPKAGVDYTVASADKVTFGGAAIDLGAMDLVKAPTLDAGAADAGDGGH